MSDDGDSSIRMELVVCDLKSAPDYKAISYTWGEEEKPQEVYLNGIPLLVRSSCQYALWQARLHHPNSYIWIDSICINQQDSDEKSCQVQLMGDIYSAASLVLACVGCHANDSKTFQTYSTDMEACVAAAKEREKSFESVEPPSRLWALAREDKLLNLSTVFSAFAQRSYWSRLWIVQELVLSRHVEVLCGDSKLSWIFLDFLADTFVNREYYFEQKLGSGIRERSKFYKEIPHLSPSGLSAIVHFIKYRKLGTHSLDETLREFGRFTCSDVRDRLNGILHLVNWSQHTDLVPIPDYESSVFQLAVQVAKYTHSVANLHHNLRCLGISRYNDGIQPEIERRRDIRDSQLSRPVLDVDRFFATFQEDPSFPAILQHVAVVGFDSHGRMTAGLKEPIIHQPGVCAEFGCKPFKSGKADQVELIVNSKVAALACSGTRAGDMLLNYSECRRDVGLVVRQKSGSYTDLVERAQRYKTMRKPNRQELILDVIGQVIFMDGSHICRTCVDSKCCSKFEVDRTSLRAEVALGPSEKDMVVLLAQDVVIMPSIIPDRGVMEGRTVDLEAWKRRPTTTVGTNERGAVHMTRIRLA